MEIVNFFEKLAGRWFSQRTTHALSTQQSKAGKSDLEVTFLAADAAEVQQLCNAQNAADPLCGLRIQQSSTVDGDTKPKTLTTLIVPLSAEGDRTQDPSGDAPSYSGTLLSEGTPETSLYTLEDNVLTIIREGKDARSEERMWFITDNLRMRTGMTELASGLRVASFCSEIRLGVKPPKES
ncbi:MAG: phycobiliprotein lyase [Cyanobacteria bacterium J06597_16]